jgi:hypothetical protein
MCILTKLLSTVSWLSEEMNQSMLEAKDWSQDKKKDEYRTGAANGYSQSAIAAANSVFVPL